MKNLTTLTLLQYFFKNEFYLVSPAKIKTAFFNDRIIGKTVTTEILDVYQLFMDLQKFYFIFSELSKRGGRILNYVPLANFAKFVDLNEVFKVNLHFFFLQNLIESGFFTNYLTKNKLNKVSIIKMLFKIEQKFNFKKLFLKYTLFADSTKMFKPSIQVWDSFDVLLVWGLHQLDINIDRFKFQNVICACLTDLQMTDKIMMQCEYTSICGDWSVQKLEFYLILFSSFFEVFELNRLNSLVKNFESACLVQTVDNSPINLKKTLDSKKKLLLMLWFQNNIKTKPNGYYFNLYYFIWVKFVLIESYAKGE